MNTKYKIAETVVLVNLVNFLDRVYLKGTKAVIADYYDNDSYVLYFYDRKNPIVVKSADFKIAETVVLVKILKSVNKSYQKGTEAIIIGCCGKNFHILDFNDDNEPIVVEADYFERKNN